MRSAVVLAGCLWAGFSSVAFSNTVPDGWWDQIKLQDINPEIYGETHQIRYRFIWNSLSVTMEYADLAPGLMRICNEQILPNLGTEQPEMWQIVVSVADQETILGDMDPEVAQIFDSFAVVDGSCSWGAF